MVIKRDFPLRGVHIKKKTIFGAHTRPVKEQTNIYYFLRGNHHKYFSRKSLQQGNAFNVKSTKKDHERQKAKDNWSYDVF